MASGDPSELGYRRCWTCSGRRWRADLYVEAWIGLAGELDRMHPADVDSRGPAIAPGLLCPPSRGRYRLHAELVAVLAGGGQSVLGVRARAPAVVASNPHLAVIHVHGDVVGEDDLGGVLAARNRRREVVDLLGAKRPRAEIEGCLLYTSDAADE